MDKGIKKMLVGNFEALQRKNGFSIRYIFVTFILLTSIGCSKISLKSNGAKKVVEGIVYDDCNGKISVGKKICLKYASSGCFGGEDISEEVLYTDQNGYFKFRYRESINDGSTTSYYHYLTIPNSTINIVNPDGNLNLYPNDTIMNALIQLKFHNTYSSRDTFFCQFKPSPNGIVEEAEQIQYFVGPFRDTTLQFRNLRIGNTTSRANILSNCGEFKWGIGRNRLDSYYTGHDGGFRLTHTVCTETDHFEHDVVPR
ncbi:MAG: hypothetical protein IPJ31_09290 [Bacteroidetes bacterium]|nr:hypothetical protein [Bacteroidota bacterium]